LENEMKLKVVSKEERFVDAYWQWKRRLRTTEPTFEEFGLHEEIAALLAKHVHRRFEQQALRRIRIGRVKVAA